LLQLLNGGVFAFPVDLFHAVAKPKGFHISF